MKKVLFLLITVFVLSCEKDDTPDLNVNISIDHADLYLNKTRELSITANGVDSEVITFEVVSGTADITLYGKRTPLEKAELILLNGANNYTITPTGMGKLIVKPYIDGKYYASGYFSFLVEPPKITSKLETNPNIKVHKVLDLGDIVRVEFSISPQDKDLPLDIKNGYFELTYQLNKKPTSKLTWGGVDSEFPFEKKLAVKDYVDKLHSVDQDNEMKNSFRFDIHTYEDPTFKELEVGLYFKYYNQYGVSHSHEIEFSAI